MKLWIKILIVLVIIFAGYGIWQYFSLQKAHSTFEDYYKFRGCTELISRETDFAICRLNSGEEIKIVKFDNKWYLDGDLPGGFLSW